MLSGKTSKHHLANYANVLFDLGCSNRKLLPEWTANNRYGVHVAILICPEQRKPEKMLTSLLRRAFRRFNKGRSRLEVFSSFFLHCQFNMLILFTWSPPAFFVKPHVDVLISKAVREHGSSNPIDISWISDFNESHRAFQTCMPYALGFSDVDGPKLRWFKDQRTHSELLAIVNYFTYISLFALSQNQ